MGKMRTLEAMQSRATTTAAIRRTHPKSHIRRFKYAYDVYEINMLLGDCPNAKIESEWRDVYVLQVVDFERGESVVVEFMTRKDYLEACDKGEL